MISLGIDSKILGWELLDSRSDFEVYPFQDLEEIAGNSHLQALVVRTTTRIEAEVLDNYQNLEFIGTASAGFDHLNIQLLNERNIRWANSPACNAKAVAEYVILAISRANLLLEQTSIGIVGVGNVGSEVSAICRQAGLNIVEYDPPRMLRDKTFTSASWEDILETDIVSIHTPLDDSTFQILDQQFFSNSGARLIINAARGGVMDEKWALRFAEQNHLVVDTWMNEPNFDAALAHRCLLATPHIAGYSSKAKINASNYVFDALFDHFNINNRVLIIEKNDISKSLEGISSMEVLCSEVFPLKEYELGFQQLFQKNAVDKVKGFHLLRNKTSLRPQFDQITLINSHLPPEHLNVLAKIGFNVI